jgi:hypothetical protein
MLVYKDSNGKVIVPGIAFSLPNGIKCPANFLQTASIYDLQAAGITTTTLPDPVPPLPQTAAAKIAAGAAIISSGTPSLNATYAIDPASQAQIGAIATYINTNGKFPSGLASLPWPDQSGTVHAFINTAQFMAFASAVADIVTLIILGQSPPQTATIP